MLSFGQAALNDLVEIKFWLAVYKSGTGTSGRVCGDLGLGTWGRETRDLSTLSMGRGDVWDAGTSKTGTQGTRDVNNYCKSRR